MTALNTLQAPRSVVMIRPHAFRPNLETAADNAFQRPSDATPETIAAGALAEFDATVARLTGEGVRVHVFEDDGSRDTPDSVFPNNWFSTHPGGQVALYPMFAANRRRERRGDVVEMLKHEYRVSDVIDYSGLEQDGLSLEGTGAMVLDHIGRIAFTARSNRADPLVLERFCTHFNYEPIAFDAADADGRAVYHTNVLMCVGTGMALVGLDMITASERRETVLRRLAESGREVIALDAAQIARFAGNAIELSGAGGHLLALSETAHAALTPGQRERIAGHARLVPLAVPTIELAGGSVRCMIAGIHLTPRNAR